MWSQLSAGFVSLLAVTSSRATLLPKSGLEAGPYDFVIVGGGTAGSVVASRLSENPKVKVLVLEAGPRKAHPDLEIPFICNTFTAPNVPYDWNYTTTAQAFLGGRSVHYPRGHVLGGSTAINYQVYTRGTSEDWDRYARVTGDPGWSWDKMLPYFKKNEKFAMPTSVAGRTIFPEHDPAFHGTDGMAGVTLPGHQTSIDGRVLQASQELGGEFAYNKDVNSGNSLGLAWLQSTIAGGKRVSAATAYLPDTVLQRRNLHVVVGAEVSRVIQTGHSDRPSFRGVEFRIGENGPLRTVIASKEVILSAGAIGSPHILLNSGIGDKAALQAIGVKPLVHLPEVGRNMTDRPFGGVPFNVTGKDTFDDYYRNETLRAALRDQWETSKTGLLVNTLANHLIFSRLPEGHPAFQLEPKDPAAGPNTPHFELLIADGVSFGPIPDGNFLAFGLSLQQPSSRGSLTLRSKNPFDAPIIDPALLTTPFDRATAREGIRSILRFVSAPVWKDYVIAPTFPIIYPEASDGELDFYLSVAMGTFFHPSGTAKMSPKSASWGVVDPDLRVKKVTGLRVVDLSIVPFIPSAHTQAPTYVIGERAADLIKAAYKIY